MKTEFGGPPAREHRAENRERFQLIMNSAHPENSEAWLTPWKAELDARLRAEVAKRSPEQLEKRRVEIRLQRRVALDDVEAARSRIAGCTRAITDANSLIAQREWSIQQLDREDQLLGTP